MRIEFLNCSAKNEIGYTMLSGINLVLREGSFNIISGDDKSGKSFLLYLARGHIKSTEGKVLINKESLAEFSNNKLYQHHQNLPLMTKNPELISRLNVFDNISLPLKIRGIGQYEIKRRVREALNQLDIKHHEFASPKNLAAGVQQRICIGRCMALKPKAILINDIFFHLNSKEKQMVTELLVTLNKAGTTILLVTDITRIHRIEGARYLTLWRGELSPS